MGRSTVFLPLLLFLLPMTFGGLVVPDIGNVISDLTKAKFQDFLIKHNLFFADKKEKEHRLNIFAENLDKIKELNERKAGGKDAVFGINEFSHLTFDEFKKMMLVENVNMSSLEDNNTKPAETRLSRGHGNHSLHHRFKRQAVATSLDWRQYGGVTPVKNQGGCGSCWAFSAVAAAEAQYALSYGPHMDLSEQELVNCETYSSGCSGGNPLRAAEYIRIAGIHHESVMPYTAQDGTCTALCGEEIKTVGTDNLAGYTEDQMRDYLYYFGPFTHGFGCGPEFQHYVGGIFDPPTCPSVNHGMLVVGYGVSNGQNYWISKNSWGTGWGEAGYIRFPRGVNKCGFKSLNICPWFT